MEGLSDLYDIVEEPLKYAMTLKGEGRRIIGYFCSYTPEEMILASGAHPMRLFGTRQDITSADSHLQSYSCSLVRGALESALRGELDFLEGTVFPHTCDSIQRLSDIWRLNTGYRFFADVILPVKLNTRSAREYMEAVLRKFRKKLSEGMGIEISDEMLGESFETYNTIRRYLEEIYDLRSANPASIGGGDLYTLVRASMVMDRYRLVERLPEIAREVKARSASRDPGKAKRLILVGSICDEPDIHRILEGYDAFVVADDLCTGSRYFEGQIDTSIEPVRALAERYMERVVCPAKHRGLTSRADRLVELCRRHRADGVIFLLLKFCDPHDFDYPCIKEALDSEGIPNMLMEVEGSLPSEGQLRTRLETFIHML